MPNLNKLFAKIALITPKTIIPLKSLTNQHAHYCCNSNQIIQPTFKYNIIEIVAKSKKAATE